MSRSLLLLLTLLLLIGVSPVLAQTDTPTPTPTSTPTTIPALPVPTFDLIASPTPIPTNDAATVEPASGLPLNQIYQYLGTAYVTLNQAPSDITHPGGIAILPNVNFDTLFGYVRWLLSSSTADAIFGPFSVFMLHVAAFFAAVVVLTNIYLIIFILRLLMLIVVWIYNKVTQLIP